MIDLILAIASASSGAAAKVLWDAYVQNKKTIELEIWKIRVSELEKRLSLFYWPIYLRLQRDNIVWTKIRERQNQSDEERQKLGYQIEKGILLPNHAEIIKIIETNMHLAGADKEFEELLLAYVRHVDVYRSIRDIGIRDKDPIYFGEPYPAAFLSAFESRLIKFQREYDSILRDKGIG